MSEIINLFLFYLFYFLFFVATLGYGRIICFSIFTNKRANFFDPIFFGTLFYLLIGYVLYLTLGISHYTNITVLVFGIILFFWKKNETKILNIPNIFIFLLIFFSGLLTSKTHVDFSAYHFFSIYQIFDSKLTIGLPLINFRFAHASLLSFNQSLFVLPFFNFKLINLPIFFIYISTVGYFLYQYHYLSKNFLEKFYCLFVLSIALIKFSRLSEYGYDIPSQFLLLVVFHKIYFANGSQSEVIKSFILFALTIMIKTISIFFFPIFITLFFKKRFNEIIAIFKKRSFVVISIILFLIFVSNSFLRTACFFYPINQTCFSNEKIFWSQKKELQAYKAIVSNHAKGYYHQDKSKYEPIKDNQEYIKNFSWIKYWIDIHFFYKIFEFLLICVFIFLLLYFLTTKEKKSFYLKNYNLILFLTIVSIFFWFITIPQLRFILSSIVIFIFIIFFIFFKKVLTFKKKSIFIFLIFVILVFNTKNFVRINNELNVKTVQHFTNFPWYEQQIQYQNLSNFFESELSEKVSPEFDVEQNEYNFVRVIKKRSK